jgi:chromosome segregation ATPase
VQHEAELAALQAQLAQTTGKLETLESRLGEAVAAAAVEATRNKALDSELANLRTQQADMELRLTEANNNLATERREAQRLQTESTGERDRLEARLAGLQAQLAALTAAREQQEAALRAHDARTVAQDRELAELQERLANSEREAEQLRRQTGEQAAQIETFAAQLHAAQVARDQHEAARRDLETRLSSTEKEFHQWREEAVLRRDEMEEAHARALDAVRAQTENLRQQIENGEGRIQSGQKVLEETMTLLRQREGEVAEFRRLFENADERSKAAQKTIEETVALLRQRENEVAFQTNEAKAARLGAERAAGKLRELREVHQRVIDVHQVSRADFDAALNRLNTDVDQYRRNETILARNADELRKLSEHLQAELIGERARSAGLERTLAGLQAQLDATLGRKMRRWLGRAPG